MPQIVHNLRTAVIAGNGKIVTIFNGNDWTPATLVAAIKEASDLR
jgi:cytochrome oxidase Cu insertion factor (SCO1/SenC/PrrC family)